MGVLKILIYAASSFNVISVTSAAGSPPTCFANPPAKTKARTATPIAITTPIISMSLVIDFIGAITSGLVDLGQQCPGSVVEYRYRGVSGEGRVSVVVDDNIFSHLFKHQQGLNNKPGAVCTPGLWMKKDLKISVISVISTNLLIEP